MPGPQLTCSRSGPEVVEIATLFAAAVSAALLEREQLPDGLALRLRSSEQLESTVREFARRERQCCPFLDISVEHEADELRVEMRGPAEARAVLALLSRLASPAR